MGSDLLYYSGKACVFANNIRDHCSRETTVIIFHPNIAFEGSCEFLDHLDSNDFDPNLDASILAFNGNFKGYLTTQRVQPFVLLGIGITRFQFEQDGDKDDDVGVTAHFGGGLDYYLVPQVSIGLTVAYVVTSGKIEDLNHTTIGMGAQYRF